MRIFTALLLAFAAWSQPLQVGTARRDITPRAPTPMWGYGARHAALSEGVLDPLYAEALVLQTGGRKVAIVGLDLGRPPAEDGLQRIRARIRREAGIEYSFIAASHTHHGPVLELQNEDGKGKGRFDATLAYYKELEDGIAGAIIEANGRLAPARMAAGSMRIEGYNRNRHTKLEPKPSDRELAVMRFDDLAGKPRAIVVNFAAHPTSIPAQTMKFSADYVGAMKQKVAQETGAAVIFMQGAAGDQSADRGNKDYREFGKSLGGEVVKLASSLTPQDAASPGFDYKEDRFTFNSRTDFRNPVVVATYSQAFFPELIKASVDEYLEGVRPRLSVGLLNGDIAMVGVSGEFFANHSLRLKERARVKQVFFFGYCNGYHWYFPTVEAVAEGGYGADATVSPVAVGAGEQLMNTALIWLYQMLGKIH